MNNWHLRIEDEEGLGTKKLIHSSGKEILPAFGLVPSMTGVEGAYLSAQDWEQLGFPLLAFNLPQLLMKPGLESLLNAQDLNQFSCTSSATLLNANFASSIKYRELGKSYQFKSSFDGARILLGHEIEQSLLRQLKPDFFVASNEAFHEESTVINRYDKANTLHQCGIGYAYVDKDYCSFDELLTVLNEQRSTHPDKLHYVIGNYNLRQLLLLLINGADLVETSTLASDAIDGVLYATKSGIDLTQQQYESDFQPIDTQCPCYTCNHFTRAYLYHLHTQTPLLSKRLKIVHNLAFSQFVINQLKQFSKQGKLREFINSYIM